jgi:hypothetical protein
MMQVNEAQDDALKTNFNAYPNRKGIFTEVIWASLTLAPYYTLLDTRRRGV